MPELDPETGDYRCYIEVSGLPPSPLAMRYVWGADSLQALQQAIQGVRSAVEPHKQLLRWGEDDWLGLPRPIPSGLGPEIDRRFENAVNRESARLHKKFFGTTLVAAERKEHADKTPKSNSSPRAKANKKNSKEETPMKYLPISERFYDWSGRGGRLHVVVYKPERAPGGYGFRCYFRLSNFPPGNKRLPYAWGIDSLQAIQQAIQGIRESLKPHEDSLGFLGMIHRIRSPRKLDTRQIWLGLELEYCLCRAYLPLESDEEKHTRGILSPA